MRAHLARDEREQLALKDEIARLEREHKRLGQLIQTIDGTCWWTDAEPGREKVADLQKRTAKIRSAIDYIERVAIAIGC